MESPHGIDARSYEEVLGVLARVAPTMPVDARSRAAWQVARSKLNLADAVVAEGYSLHGARVAAPAAPHGQPTPAQVAELAALKAEIAALRGSSSPASAAAGNFPAEADHAGTFPPGYDAKSLAAHKAAMRLMNVCRGMRYNAALAAVSRWNA